MKKIFNDITAFTPILKNIKKTKKSIVFTNGCFDLIHVGHLDYLKRASLLGNILIVGLNHDNSIKKLKGISRPILNFEKRSLFLSYLDFIDFIVGFEEETPIKLIETITPDILVKGGDYTIDNIVGSDIVKKKNGRIVIMKFKYNISTTYIINKIKGI